VGADEAVVEQAFGIEQFRRGLAGGLEAFVGFALGFGDVGMDDQVVWRRKSRQAARISGAVV
jgi:hypothetical protein